MGPADGTNVNKPLDDAPFRYVASKGDVIRIYHHDRLATTLRGRAAVRFVGRVDSLDGPAAQQLMARETGQYRFGNERLAGATRRGKGRRR